MTSQEALEQAVDSLLVDLEQMEALEVSLLWLLCDNLPMSAAPGRGDLIRTLLAPNSDLMELGLPRTGPEAWRAYYLESMTDAQTLNEGLVASLSTARPVAAVASTSPAFTYGQAVLLLAWGLAIQRHVPLPTLPQLTAWLFRPLWQRLLTVQPNIYW